MFHTTPAKFSADECVGKDISTPSCALPTCTSLADAGAVAPLDLREQKGRTVYWTYDVAWEPSPIRWASRWDPYLSMPDEQVHWFSILNSVMIVLLLAGLVAMIMVRTLRNDLRRYEEMETGEEPQEETGWKLIHGDVFRPPAYGGFLSVLIGSGIQLMTMALVVLIFALFGFLSPANRGAMMSAALFLFVFMGYFVISFVMTIAAPSEGTLALDFSSTSKAPLGRPIALWLRAFFNF